METNCCTSMNRRRSLTADGVVVGSGKNIGGVGEMSAGCQRMRCEILRLYY